MEAELRQIQRSKDLLDGAAWRAHHIDIGERSILVIIKRVVEIFRGGTKGCVDP